LVRLTIVITTLTTASAAGSRPVTEFPAVWAYTPILAKSSGLSELFFTIARCLASAPQRTARQEAVFGLLMKAWSDYDTWPTRPAVDGNDSGPAWILVVDDDPVQRRLLTSVLEEQRYAVETASDGLDAVRKIRNGCFDLALIDYDMPEIDGLAAGTLIRDLIGKDVRPRMVGLTATAALLSQKEGLPRSIFDEILQKSPDFDRLKAAVDKHMRASPNLMTRQAAAPTGSKHARAYETLPAAGKD